MPNVLLLGGAGYLGTAIGQALRRTGVHDVWATTRDAKKKNVLLSNEIHPLVGDLSDRNFVETSIAAYRIDVVVDISQAYTDATTVLEAVRNAASSRKAALHKDGAVGPKLGFIYGSGQWVHGNTGDERISDTMVPGTSLAVGKPGTAVGWRPGHEQAVLAAQELLDVAILRPSSIYGRGSWIFNTWWDPILASAQSGHATPVRIPATKSSLTGLVHVEDAAEGYVAAIARLGTLGSWPVFDLHVESVRIDDMLTEVARVLGAGGEIVYAGTQGNPFFEAVALSAHSSGARAKAVLGWAPRQVDFMRELPTTVAAWKAAKEL
ncbi:hypothetical protein ANO11243_091890 [Dothideomycetidae sp. 11243]|nr:hypothetical protein ANO11243_091890 [fungal sp. No.11243]